MTSKLEQEMDKIAEGELSFDEVVNDSRSMLAQVLEHLDKNREAIGDEIRKALQVKNTIGTCHATQHPLVIRRARSGKRFVGCSGWPDCEITYPLPQYGKITADLTTCPACTAPVIRVGGNKGRTWVTCLTVGCKGAEEREAAEREQRKADKQAAQESDEDVEVDEDAAPPGEVDAEDLGLDEEGEEA